MCRMKFIQYWFIWCCFRKIKKNVWKSVNRRKSMKVKISEDYLSNTTSTCCIICFCYIPYMLLCMAEFGEGNGTPLQYSCLENPMDGGAWWAAVHGVGNSWTRLSDFTFNFHFYALEKEMATHSSVLAWRIPGMGEPGGLPSMGLHRVGHN